MMRHKQKNRMHGQKAFTLIESMVAMIIIGIAMAALIAASTSMTRVSGAGINISTAEFLIEEIRELTTDLPVVDPETDITTFGPEEPALVFYDDLDDFNGASFSPPIDITRNQLVNFTGFTQQVTVQNVGDNNPADGVDLTAVTVNHGSDFVRITVDILLNGNIVSSSSWIRTRM